MNLFKTFEEAAVAVDEMFESTKADADVDSGDESGDEEERAKAPGNEDGDQDSEHVGTHVSFFTLLTPNRAPADLHHRITWFCLMQESI